MWAASPSTFDAVIMPCPPTPTSRIVCRVLCEVDLDPAVVHVERRTSECVDARAAVAAHSANQTALRLRSCVVFAHRSDDFIKAGPTLLEGEAGGLTSLGAIRRWDVRPGRRVVDVRRRRWPSIGRGLSSKGPINCPGGPLARRNRGCDGTATRYEIAAGEDPIVRCAACLRIDDEPVVCVPCQLRIGVAEKRPIRRLSNRTDHEIGRNRFFRARCCCELTNGKWSVAVKHDADRLHSVWGQP